MMTSLFQLLIVSIATLVFVKCTSIFRCKSNYMGDLIFEIDLSSHFSHTNDYKFYLGNPYDAACPWVQERDCVIVGKTLRCVMHTIKEGHCITYTFVIHVIDSKTGINTKNISDFVFSGFKESLKVIPWSASMKLHFCNDTVGVKYFAVYPIDYTKLKIDFFRYPLDLKSYPSTLQMSISGRTNNYNKTTRLEMKILDQCVGHTKDSCTIIEENLEPCSTYRVCIKPSYIRCRDVETKCFKEFRWQDILLIIFGIIICVLSVLFLSAKLKESRTRRQIHSFSRFVLVGDKERPSTSAGGGSDEANPENLYGHFLE